MTYTVRIYGNDPQTGPGALLGEHEFTSRVEAWRFARDMAVNAPELGETVTLDGQPFRPGPHMISPYRGRWAIP